jgi:nitrate reductase NapAB chaperone NapD
MTVVVKESDDEQIMWSLGKASRLSVVIKLLLVLHYYWFVIMLLIV